MTKTKFKIITLMNKDGNRIRVCRLNTYKLIVLQLNLIQIFMQQSNRTQIQYYCQQLERVVPNGMAINTKCSNQRYSQVIYQFRMGIVEGCRKQFLLQAQVQINYIHDRSFIHWKNYKITFRSSLSSSNSKMDKSSFICCAEVVPISGIIFI